MVEKDITQRICRDVFLRLWVCMGMRNAQFAVRKWRKVMIETICENKLFLAAYRKGGCVPARYVVVYLRPNGKKGTRVGITAGKKVGNAVHRNRAKRVIRAAIRELSSQIPMDMDLVVVARTQIAEAKTEDVRKELHYCIAKLTGNRKPKNKTEWK